MSSRLPPVIRGLAIAVAATVATVGLSLVARDYLNISATPMILGGLIIAAWFGGRLPGLVYCVFTDLTVDYLFGEPRYEFTPDPIAHAVRLIVLITVSLIISSLRTALDRLEIRARQQAAVAEFGRSALSGTKLPDLLSEAVERVVDVLNLKSSAICRIDSTSDEMYVAAAQGWSQELHGQRLSFRERGSLAGYVAESAEPVVLSDLRKNGSLTASQFATEEGTRSMAGVRIVSRDGVYGVLGAFDTVRRDFSDDDINFLQSITNVIAEAVDRIRKEEEVDEQRSWLQTVLTSIGDGVIATDADGLVIFLNKVAQELTGWDEISARGRKLNEVFRIKRGSTPEDRTDRVAGLADHAILLSRDGKEIPIDDRSSPITDSGGVRGVVLVFSDVSERKKSQGLVLKRADEIAALYGFTDRLQRADSIDEVYDAALDSIMGAVKSDRASILLFDESGRMQFVASRGLSENYRSAASGHSPWKQGEKGAEPIGIDDVRTAEIDIGLKRSIIDEGIVALGFIPLISSGTLIGKMMIYFDEPHEFARSEFELAMTVANQIATGVERKQAESRLLENEERLRLATQAGKVGVWDWDIRSNRVEWTDAIYEMHGLGKGDFDGSVDSFTSLIHPEDRSGIRAAIERSLTTGEPYQAEFRTVRPDGEIRWLFTNARVLRDAEGPQRLIGATADITERVKAEAAKRENEIMQRLVDAQEAERKRIARDLHDHLGQKMTGLRFKIESALSRSNENPGLQELLDEIQESALQIDHDIGFLSWELRPTELDTLGLDDALASFVREWSGQYAINAEFHSNLSEMRAQRGRLSHTIEMNLYRIAQEGLNNIMKHANAKSVSVLLRYRRDSLVLIIEDDGQGLADDFKLNAGKSNGSFGLIGMHERAALLKGSFEVESRPGSGTTLITTVPLYKVLARAEA